MKIIPLCVFDWSLEETNAINKNRKRLLLRGEIDDADGGRTKVRFSIVKTYTEQPENMLADASGRVIELAGYQERKSEVEEAKKSLPQKNGSPDYHHSALENHGGFIFDDIEEIELSMPVAPEGYLGKEEVTINLYDFFPYECIDNLMVIGGRACYNTKKGIATTERSRTGKIVKHALSMLHESEGLMFNMHGSLATMNSKGELIKMPDVFTQEDGDNIYCCLKYSDFVFITGEKEGSPAIIGGFTSVDGSNKVYRYGVEETEYLLGGKQTFISGM
jgi:hypothetical protein